MASERSLAVTSGGPRPALAATSRKPNIADMTHFARARLAATASACALALALCAACVHFHAKPVSPTSTLQSLESRSLDSPQLLGFLREHATGRSWPPASWDLDSLTLAAFYFSPELDVARAQWGVAQAGRITAGERENPSLSVSEGYNASAEGVTPWIPEAVLDLVLPTAGKRGIRIAQARSRAETARLDLLDVAWQVRSNVRGAFLELFAARQRAELLAERDTLRARAADLLQQQQRLGEVSANEATQASIALDQGRLETLGAEQHVAATRIVLAGALGLPASALDGAALSFDGLANLELALSAQEVRRRAVTSRADVLAALAGYQTSQAALQLEVARQYPDLKLGLGYQLDQTDSKWTLGLGIALPIFHRNRGAIAEAEAGREESAARLLALQSRVLNQIDAALEALDAATERHRAAAALVDRQSEQEAAARRFYALGEISEITLLEAQLELSAGRLAELDALSQQQRAATDLEDAMQSPLDGSTLDQGAWVLTAPDRTLGPDHS